MIIKCCFLFLQDNSMYYYNIRYINIFVLKCIFLISVGGVACGRDLGRGQISLLLCL